MKLTVFELLNTDMLKNAKIISGEKGIYNQILSGTIIEAPDIAKFISGGEVLLTGLYAFEGCTLDVFKEYVYQLSQKKISAIIVKTGRKVTFEEEKIEFMQHVFDAENIPVIEIPYEVSFRDILSFIMQKIFNEEVSRLKYFKTTYDNFTALPLSSDSKENRIEGILNVLENMIGNKVAIFSRNMECVAATSESIKTFVFDNDAEKIDLGVYSRGVYWKQKNRIEGKYEGYTQIVATLSIVMDIKLYLIITETKRPVTEMDYIAIDNALTALKQEFFRQYSLEELERKYENDLTSNLLNGRIRSIGDLKRNRKVKLLNMPIDASYRVIVFRLEHEQNDIWDFDTSVRYMKLLERAVGQYMPNVWKNSDVESLAVIQQIDKVMSPKMWKKEIRETVEEIQGYLSENDNKLQVQAGVGKTVDGVINLHESFSEANDTLKFMAIDQHFQEEKTSRVMFFSDLGIFNLLCKIEDSEMLRQYIPESLQKLLRYKRPQRDDLLLTLQTYLDRNMNLTNTAQDLYIHYRTAIYRIKKIKDITGIDFDNPNEVLAVRIGLFVYHMIENRQIC